ncbi:MAG: hypothetical protein ICV83_20695, partial [Cytophagales bacterium]|nr:hypothetical protein [Cytophagales bacterium]
MEHTSRTVQLRSITSSNSKEQAYWTGKLSGPFSKSSIPSESSAAGQPYQAGVVPFGLDGPLYNRLITLSGNSDRALHVCLFTGVLLLTARLSGNTDLVLGIPITRQQAEGAFINTVLPIRVSVSEKTTFKQLLIRVRETILEAEQHQNYPIDVLGEQLGLGPGEAAGCPLFDVAVLLEDIHRREYLADARPSLTFGVRKAAGALEGYIEYNAGLYSGPFVTKLGAHVKRLLAHHLDHLEEGVFAADLLLADEEYLLKEKFNATQLPYDREKTINQLFEAQAAATPDRLAVVCEGTAVTYRHLNELSNGVAAALV